MGVNANHDTENAIKRTVLIVEDEIKLSSLVADYLKQSGFLTECIADGALVLPWLENNNTDLIVLDLMLPNKDGIDICRDIRRFSEVPIIIATARVEEIDRLLGLELGADDYICKPYSLRELVARVKTILRRVKLTQLAGQTAATMTAVDFIVDSEHYQIRFREHALDLTPAEYRLLSTLLTPCGRVYSRAQLLERLYTDHRIVTDRTVDTHIKNVRKKLADLHPEADRIRSIYGVGYKMELEVEI